MMVSALGLTTWGRDEQGRQVWRYMSKVEFTARRDADWLDLLAVARVTAGEKSWQDIADEGVVTDADDAAGAEREVLERTRDEGRD